MIPYAYWKDFPGIPEALEKVSGIIRAASKSENPVIAEGVSSLFNGNGKLLRPALLLMAAGFGKPKQKHYQLAACLEMLHMATLIHDDVIDDSPLRRGIPTAHVRYGKRNAVLLGDYLLSRCFILAANYTSPENALALAKIISLICGMEIEQNSDAFKTNISRRRYFRKITGKSALLFSLACHVGAAEAKAARDITERLRRIGYNIGMAFQIIDDILDYAGDPQRVRKTLGNDIKAGLVTLPLICAVPRDAGGTLRALFAGDAFSAGDSKTIITAVRAAGGVEEARRYAAQYTGRALRELRALPEGQPRDKLEKLTRRLLERDF